ncbi:MAG: endo-1,4-beta-xylanase [Treponema sp.]|jgi:GH35 family endo-1,4-beta-xylanase|nr:endo-1,4-beta-xylanase [Treponema sp.]
MTDTASRYEHRKSTCKVRILDARRNALAGTAVKVQQLKHEFLFGCGAFDVLAAASPFPGADRAFLDERAEKWFALFNFGTLPFYWGNFEPEEGKPRTEMLLAAARMMKDHGVTAKGHPLCWHTVCADWLLKYDTDTILKKQLARITRDVTDFKGTIDIWDAINEVVIMPNFDKYDNAVTRLCRKFGRSGLVKDVFNAAREANPGGIFLINDFNTTVAYEVLIDCLLDAGVPIDAIGIQSHQHQGYWGKEKIEDVLERFSRFGLPLHFTENTIISGSPIPPEIEDLNDWQVKDWPSTPEYEARQAEQLEEMYRTLFAHPQVQAITGWDFADGAWLNAPSGLLRKDNSEKPAYTMLKNLIRKEWWTDCTVTTDEQGYAEVHGFKGTYRLQAGTASAQFVLADGSTQDTVVLEENT